MTLLDYYKSRFGEAVKRQGGAWNVAARICGVANTATEELLDIDEMLKGSREMRQAVPQTGAYELFLDQMEKLDK